MEYDKFYEWLVSDKKMNHRSAKDVVSRCKRVCNISGVSSIDDKTEIQLINASGYDETSMFVKSQLKRSIVLYNEFLRG